MRQQLASATPKEGIMERHYQSKLGERRRPEALSELFTIRR